MIQAPNVSQVRSVWQVRIDLLPRWLELRRELAELSQRYPKQFHGCILEGWDWQLENLTGSLVNFLLLREVHYRAGRLQHFVNIVDSVRQDDRYLVTGFDVTQPSIPFLMDIVLRAEVMPALAEPEALAYIIDAVGGPPVVSVLAHQLNWDLGFTECVRRGVECATTRLVIQQRVAQDAYHEICRRLDHHLADPCERALVGTFFDTIESRHTQHYHDSMSHLLRMSHRYTFPADFSDEKQSILDLLIGEQTQGLQHANLRSQLEWIEQKETEARGQHLTRNIFQGLQKEHRNQTADKRGTDVLGNRVYLDAPADDGESGRTVGDQLVSSHPDEFTHPAQELQDPNIPLNERKRADLKALLGKTGFRVFELQIQDASLTAQQVADQLGVNEKTVDRNRAKLRKHYETIQAIIYD